MNWHDLILSIRQQPEFQQLLSDCYLEEDLQKNVERFRKSEEYIATKEFIREHFQENKLNILDAGSGNGISALAFALDGHSVTALEPDKSDTVGCAAIEKLKLLYDIDNLTILNSTAEELSEHTQKFDLVYSRQAMHHAADLDLFVLKISQALKPGGIYFASRDHVLLFPGEKKLFLDLHPLHKFYGGENAFTEKEYISSITKSGMTVTKIIKTYDSVINFAPLTRKGLAVKIIRWKKTNQENLQSKIGNLAKRTSILNLYHRFIAFRYGKPLDEKNSPGRIYSFIAIKP